MAIKTMTIDYSGGLNHSIVIDCGSTPIDVSVFWRKASDSIWIPVKSLTGKTGNTTINHNVPNINDLISPNEPTLDISTVKVDPVAETVSFTVSLPTDEGSRIFYKAVDTTNNVIIEDKEAYVTSGLAALAVKVDDSPTTKLTRQDSTGNLNTRFKLPLYANGKVNYIHMAVIDNGGNISNTATEDIDLIPPSSDNIFKINDIRIAVDGQVLRISGNRMIASVSGAAHPKGTVIYRDIRLLDAQSNENLASFNYTGNVNNIDLHVNPFNNPKITAETKLQLASRAFNSFGASLGEVKSKPFMIDMTSPTVKITFEETLPLLIEKSTMSETYRLAWSTSGDLSNEITKYRIEYRHKPNSQANWSEWSKIGESYQTNFNIPKNSIKNNGFNIHEFRVCGVTPNGDTRYFIYPKYMADVLVVLSTSGTSLVYAVRIPMGVFKLVDQTVKLVSTVGSHTRTVAVGLNYDDISGRIGNKDLTFLTLPVENDLYFDSQGNTKIDVVTRTVEESLVEVYNSRAFRSETSKEYTTKIDNRVVDVFLAGFIYLDNKDLPQEFSLNYVADSNNPFKSTATFNMTSKLSIVSNRDGRELLSINLNKNNMKQYKFGTLNLPTLSFAKQYKNESKVDGVIEYSPPVSLRASKHSGDNNIPNTTVKINYSRSYGLDFEKVDNYDPNGEPLTQPGTYNVYAQTVFSDGSAVKSSEETIMVFNIKDTLTEYVTPFLTIDNSNNTGRSGSTVDLICKTFIKKNDKTYITSGKYTYSIRNKNNAKVLQFSLPEGDTSSLLDNKTHSYNLRLTVDGDFLEYGTNELELTVNYSGQINKYTHSVDYIRPVDAPESSSSTGIFGSPTFRDSFTTDNSPKFNSISMRVQSFDPKLNLVSARVGSKSYFLLPNYSFPVYRRSGTITGIKYEISPSNRKKESLYTSIDEVSSFSPIDRQSVVTDNLDSTTRPPVPSIRVHANEKLSPFSDDGSTICVAKNSISFSLADSNPEYQTSLFIDGQPYLSGSNFSKTGGHTLMAIRRSTYNYTISHKLVKFEVVKDYKYHSPLIKVTPTSRFKASYNCSFDWYASQKEKDRRSDIRKEYQIGSNGQWVNVDNHQEDITTVPIPPEKLTFAGDSTLVINARKTYMDGTQKSSRYTIAIDYVKRLGDIPDPLIDAELTISGRNRFIYIPSVKQHPEYTYSYTINGIRYKPGDPITNFNHNVRNFTLAVTVSDILYKREQSFSKTFEINTMRPIKPICNVHDVLTSRTILKPEDLSLVNITDKEPDVDYTIILDNKVINRDYLNIFEEIPSNKMQGTHTIVLYAKSRINGLVSTSVYTFWLNRSSLTDRMHNIPIFKNDDINSNGKFIRTPIIPLSIHSSMFDTPGELVVDRQTGDLYVVTNEPNIGDDRNNGSYKLAEVTVGIRRRIKELENTVDSLHKTYMNHGEKIRALEYPIEHIEETNRKLMNTYNSKNNIKEQYQNHLANDQLDIEKIIQELREYSETLNSLKSRQNSVDYSSVKNSISQYRSTIKENIIDDYYRHLDIVSLIALISFNLKTIEFIATPKVNKSDFEDFKRQQESNMSNIQGKIRG